MKLKSVSLRKSNLTEKWVQDQIAEDPSILGLGDLILKDKERIQPRAGRLDLLLQDPESLKRYEVELQLGAIDESHLIRTIEYWDIEKRRYPQYDHCAVIVAEEITSRFLNVIQLFNGYIPFIALKMTAYEINGEYALTFVKVVDEQVFGLIDEDEAVSEPTDRSWWEKRGNAKTIKMVDRLLEVVQEVDSRVSLNYNKHYIGLKVDGTAMNFVSFQPRKAHVIVQIKCPQSQEIDEELIEVGIDTLSYAAWGVYRLRLTTELDAEQRQVFVGLVEKAHEAYGKPS